MALVHRAVLGLVITLSLSSCVVIPPSRSYDDTNENFELLAPDSHNIDHIKPVSTRVSALKTWQNSGVFIERGDVITVKSFGKWSPWSTVGLWTGPDGNESYAKEVNGINGSALMARVGHKGKPFQIGLARSFRAKDYGMLYMAMNDSFKFLYDNEGDISVEVYLDVNASQNTGVATTQRKNPVKVTAYNYDDASGKGYISVATGGQDFVARQWVLNKIGEIASTKNVAIDANRNRSEGGSYRVTDEKSVQGVLSVQFETIW